MTLMEYDEPLVEHVPDSPAEKSEEKILRVNGNAENVCFIYYKCVLFLNLDFRFPQFSLKVFRI